MIQEHFDKKNLHHAYLFTGDVKKLKEELLELLKDVSDIYQNPDLQDISVDIFKIDDARNLKSQTETKSFSGGKKIFIISTNSILQEAQNAMLKIFEEPLSDTHFFLLVPSAHSLLKTFISRFYFVESKTEENSNLADEFIKMSIDKRLQFIKDFLSESSEEEDDVAGLESPRTRANEFINQLEEALHKKLDALNVTPDVFEHIFSVRKALRMPGSAPKMLLESIALMLPKTI